VAADDHTAKTALLALGSNLPGPWGTPAETLRRALRALDDLPHTRLLRASGLWRSAPFGGVPQPAYVNAAAMVKTALPPHALLRHLHVLERAAGRHHATPWGARTLDIDLLDFAGKATRPAGMGRLGESRTHHRWQKRGLVLPHPGIHQRPFVLLPLMEIAPDWHHPLLGATPHALLHRLPPRTRASCRPLPERFPRIPS